MISIGFSFFTWSSDYLDDAPYTVFAPVNGWYSALNVSDYVLKGKIDLPEISFINIIEIVDILDYIKSDIRKKLKGLSRLANEVYCFRTLIYCVLRQIIHRNSIDMC